MYILNVEYRYGLLNHARDENDSKLCKPVDMVYSGKQKPSRECLMHNLNQTHIWYQS